MGNDAALAVLSDRQPPLFSYFKQLFAQVTNPPIDPIRESIVMSLGDRRRLRAQPARRDARARPPAASWTSRSCATTSSRRCATSPATSSARTRSTSPGRSRTGPAGMTARLAERLRRGPRRDHRRRQHPDPLRPPRRARAARRSRRCSPSPPSTTTSCAWATACSAGLVLESGEPREVHHFATLIGYGASAINPYLLLDTVDELVAEGRDPRRRRRRRRASANIVKALGKGLLKTISKMGISTIQSYCGAQIFEAVGLERELVDRHFTGTASRIGGIGVDVLAAGGARPPRARLGRAGADGRPLLPVGGVYAWRRDGEHHMWNPETIALLQHAVRVPAARATRRQRRRPDATWATRWTKYERVRAPGQRGRRRAARRCAACCASATDAEPIPLEEVEPAQGDRAALRHRRDVARLDLDRVARDARDRDEPPRRPLEHRRGRGGPAALHARRQRRPAPLGDQAGRLGPLRRDDPLPRQRRPAADQDGPGRQARRGRPAARPQGRQVHRLGAPHDAGRRPDLAAAAPRHLLDRGPQAADLRPALLEPARAGVGEARLRGRRRHRRRRRREGERRPRADRRPRRRHRRLAAVARSTRPASRGRSAWPRPSRRC